MTKASQEHARSMSVSVAASFFCVDYRKMTRYDATGEGKVQAIVDCLPQKLVMTWLKASDSQEACVEQNIMKICFTRTADGTSNHTKAKQIRIEQHKAKQSKAHEVGFNRNLFTNNFFANIKI